MITKQKNSILQQFNPRNIKGGVTLFALIFAISGGGYWLYRSFAATARVCSSFSEPIEITKGGTYSGCWQTTDRKTPAVRISTDQPVTITNSVITGNYILVKDSVAKVNLTITYTDFIGTTPRYSTSSRRAIRLSSEASNLRVENNYFENTAGIKITGWAKTNGFNDPKTRTIKILRNKVKNITNAQVEASESGGSDHLVQFVQLGQINKIAGAEIAWNEVINTYGQSRVEDNINLYQTGGAGNTEANRLRIHDNFIWGAYPNPYTENYYRGGGIIAGDTNEDLDIGWVDIYNNQVVGTTNYGISIACGHDNRAYGNRVVSSGKPSPELPGGIRFPQANVGLSGNNARAWLGRCKQNNYSNNEFKDNIVGWMNANSVRNDNTFRCNERNAKGELILCAKSINNTSSTDNPMSEITYNMEQAEYARWQQKLSENNMKIGRN